MLETVRLTGVLENSEFTTADFSKINTEGHDLFVLKGLPWGRFNLSVIECEDEDEDVKTRLLGDTFHDLARNLQDKKFNVYASE